MLRRAVVNQGVTWSWTGRLRFAVRNSDSRGQSHLRDRRVPADERFERQGELGDAALLRRVCRLVRAGVIGRSLVADDRGEGPLNAGVAATSAERRHRRVPRGLVLGCNVDAVRFQHDKSVDAGDQCLRRRAAARPASANPIRLSVAGSGAWLGPSTINTPARAMSKSFPLPSRSP